MQPSSGSAFNNNNKTNNNSSSTWANPNVGNNPFSMPSNGAFSSWGTQQSNTSNTNNNGFASAFANNNGNTSSNTWWSKPTNDANTNNNNDNQISSAFTMPTNTTSAFTMPSTSAFNPSPSKHASFGNGNGFNSKPNKNNKSKTHQRIQPTAESRVFLGNWKQKMNVFHVTLKHRQNNGNHLVVTCIALTFTKQTIFKQCEFA